MTLAALIRIDSFGVEVKFQPVGSVVEWLSGWGEKESFVPFCSLWLSPTSVDRLFCAPYLSPHH